MNKNLTEIVFVVDESGSMFHLTNDTIGGINGFVYKQKQLEGDAKLTLVKFSNRHSTIYNAVDIREVEPLTDKDYMPGGGTALLDAVGDTIEMIQDRLDGTAEDERPANIIFVVVTDGAENASYNFKKSQIKKMIEHQTKGHGWQFMYLGANVDSFSEASNMGISSQWATGYTYTAAGTAAVYDSINTVATAVRACDDSIKGVTLDSVYADSLDACVEYAEALSTKVSTD